MAWRQRIYAFLLRRILGPYLAPSSARKLHRCVEVSLTEGRFVLTDVELDPDRLNALLFNDVGGGGGGLRVRRAVVRRLGILLSLREGDDAVDGKGGGGEEGAASSPLRRTDSDPTSEALTTVGMAMNTVSKAYRLSYRTASDVGAAVSTGGGGAGVALMAHIEIDGLEIDLAPVEATGGGEAYRPEHIPQRTENNTTKSSSSGGGYISSYVDAALASLRLTLNISDVSLRAFDRRGANYAAVRLARASYHDGVPAGTAESARTTVASEQTSSAEEAVLHKSVEFDGLTVEVGSTGTPAAKEGNGATQRIVARTDGSGRFRLRATVVHEDADRQVSPADPKPPRVQKEIDATLCERLLLSLDAVSLGCLASVLGDAERCAAASGGCGAAAGEEEMAERDAFDAAATTATAAMDTLAADEYSSGASCCGGDDAAEAQHISEVMRQYTEARHLARTREVRGGMLLPSFSFNENNESSGKGDGEVSFDIFFDANEQSFHHYRSMVSEAGGWQSQIQGRASGDDENIDEFVHTKVALRLPDCSLKCSLGEDLPDAMSGEIESRVNILDCAVSMSLSETGLDATFSASHVQIEDASLDTRNRVVEASYVLRFLDPSELYEDVDIDDSEGYLVSSAPCISVDVVKRHLGHPSNEDGEITIALVLDPVELTCRQDTALRFSKLLQCIKRDDDAVANNVPTVDDTSATSAGPSLRVKAICPAFTILCPIALPSSEAEFDSFGPRFDPLFQRIGYELSSADGAMVRTPGGVGLGLTFDELSLELSTQIISDAGDADDPDAPSSPLDAFVAPLSADEMTVELKSHNAILFAYTTPRGNAGFSTRADVVAFQGESNIDNALVKVQYRSLQPRHSTSQKGVQKLNRKNNSFPLVPPLSAVKATQPRDERRPEDACSPGKGAHIRKHRGKRQHQHVRASDPQYDMSAEAAESNRNVDVNVPSIAFDLTTKERVAFLEMISETARHCEGPEPSRPGKKDPLCVSVSCKRIMMTLHGSEEDFIGVPELSDVLGGGSNHVSYIIIADGMRLHALLGAAGGLRNIRICSQDLTLYEVIDLIPGARASPIVGSQQRRESVRRHDSSLESAHWRCRQVRRRGTRSELTREARPIIFRQKLYRPLSPETSAFILDVLNRGWGLEEDADDDIAEAAGGDTERSIHCSLYDLTHRSDIKSHWRERLTVLLRGGAATDDEQDSSGNQQSSQNQEESSLLTNLFVTMSDCTLDYASPLHFATPSRSLLRFGEIRLTSNIVSPPAGPTQSYKLSIADFEHHLCNHRVPSDAEDCRLSYAGSVLRRGAGSGKGAKISSAASIEDAARRMGFVTVATLDSADAIITTVSVPIPSKARAAVKRKPGTTLTLSFGRACLYTCRDSFACFTDTFSEWIAEFTTPSEEDVSRLKALSTTIDDGDSDLLGNSIFPDGDEEPSICNDTVDTSSLPASRGTIRDLTDIPDNELSAAELRKKHGLAQNGMSDGLSSSLFSSGFGGLSAVKTKHPESGIASQSSRNPTSERGSDDSKCRLGGHGWTTVDHELSHVPDIPEQSAKWLIDGDKTTSSRSTRTSSGAHRSTSKGSGQPRMQIVQQHIPKKKDSGVFFRGGADADDGFSPDVKLRVAVRDLSVNFRFFDGYDWTDSPMVTDELVEEKVKAIKKQTNEEIIRDERPDKAAMLQRRALLIGELLEDCEYQDGMFRDDLAVGLLKHQAKPAPKQAKRKARQTGHCFSLAASGVRLQYDSFLDTEDHRLSSRMDLSMEDLFVAETISDERKPVKLLGEWFNEKEHPRDSDDGLLMMKVVSMHPVKRISDDGKYVNDESRATLQLLPLRFFLHQTAIRFIRTFFTRDEAAAEGTAAEQEKHAVEVTPTFFQRFKVFPTKLKVDYQPAQCDTAALKDGSYVELINLLPLVDMVLTLQPIELINITGWSSAFSEVTRCWLRDICATQMHKFITNTSPFHPILNVSGGVAEMFMIPIEEVKEGGSFFRGLKEGTSALAGTVAYEALNTTSKASKFAANALSGAPSVATKSSKARVVALPARPSETPSKVGQVARHAVDSILRGLEEANYKIIIVPCREYSRSGTTGAMRSVIRGIPVAVRAPLSGASEAVSYATLLARNAINPEKRKEEEATFKGLT